MHALAGMGCGDGKLREISGQQALGGDRDGGILRRHHAGKEAIQPRLHRRHGFHRRPSGARRRLRLHTCIHRSVVSKIEIVQVIICSYICKK